MSDKAAGLSALALVDKDLSKIVLDDLSQREIVEAIGTTIRRVRLQGEMIAGGFHPLQVENVA